MELRVFTEPQQGATYDDLVTVAKEAEDLGFGAFFRSDHYLGMGTEGLPGPSDAWITLAGIARETSTIRLGTLMTSATFRLPGPLAISVANVDQMSGGRVELGFGAGWFTEEHTAYGIPFPDTGERFDRFEEQLAIITGLWATPVGERFTHDGKHYQVQDSPALPKPVQSSGHAGGPLRAGRRSARRRVFQQRGQLEQELLGKLHACGEGGIYAGMAAGLARGLFLLSSTRCSCSPSEITE